jgi:hypothetical protein
MKLVVALTVVLLLAGCQGHTNVKVEDKGPDLFERREAMRNCVGQFDIRTADEHIRIACTQAIYGK